MNQTYTPYNETSNVGTIATLKVPVTAIDFSKLPSQKPLPTGARSWHLKDAQANRYLIYAPQEVPYSPYHPINFISLHILGNPEHFNADCITNLKTLFDWLKI